MKLDEILAWVSLALTGLFLAVIIFLLSGCALLSRDNVDQLREWGIDIPDPSEWPDLYERDEPEQPDEPDVPDARPPVDWRDLPESGEFRPDPRVVTYTFLFADGTTLKFRENHMADFWGDYPSAGHGQIRWPDGTVEAIDVNTRIRHRGMIAGRIKMPVTTPDHGRRMFWMARDDNSKRVPIFEDGWNPLVEGAVLAVQGDLGITSHLVSVNVEVGQ